VHKDGIYFGHIRDGMKHGFGYYMWIHTGERYQGDWFMDKRSGFGIMTWSDGRRYVGGFRNDLFDGPAVQSCADGSRYEGTWKEGNPHGIGVYTSKDGTKIEGMFVNSSWSIQEKVGQLERTVKALSKRVTNGGIEITGIDSRNIHDDS